MKSHHSARQWSVASMLVFAVIGCGADPGKVTPSSPTSSQEGLAVPSALPGYPPLPQERTATPANASPDRQPQPAPPAPLAASAEPTEALPEWGPGKSLAQAISLVAVKSQALATKYRLGFDDSVCVLGAFLRQGDELGFSRQFEQNQNYVIMGGGSGSAVDLDIAILDQAGRMLTADTAKDASPLVLFKPPRTGYYSMKIALRQSRSEGSFAAIAIMQEHGRYSIPSSSFRASFSNALTVASAYAAAVRKKIPDVNVYFHEGKGDWAFHSVVLAPSEGHVYTGFRFGSNASVVAAAGDDSVASLDLWVTDANNLVGSNSDVQPSVLFEPQRELQYQIKVRNAQSRGPALVTALVLDLQKGSAPSRPAATVQVDAPVSSMGEAETM
jgi:hypothetical protein